MLRVGSSGGDTLAGRIEGFDPIDERIVPARIGGHAKPERSSKSDEDDGQADPIERSEIDSRPFRAVVEHQAGDSAGHETEADPESLMVSGLATGR